MSDKIETTTEWVDVNYIQQHYLPVSKKIIRKMIKQNLDIARTGGRKILVQKEQLELWLKHEI